MTALGPSEAQKPCLISAKVVVAVPVYNEQKHIEQTLLALAAQTHPDFKVLISDNASDDASPGFCESFAANDPRFVYTRHETNIGAVANFNFCLDATSSEYFMWCGAHDVPSENFLSVMASILDGDTSVAIAFGKRIAIDECSVPIEPQHSDHAYVYRFFRNRYLRYLQSACGLSDCVIVNGLLRRAWLEGARLEPVKSSDKVLISHLLYSGGVRYDFSALYRRRYFEVRATSQEERVLGMKPVVAMCNRGLVDCYLSDFASITRNPHEHRTDWRIFLLRWVVTARFLSPIGKYIYSLARLSMRIPAITEPASGRKQ